MNSPMPVIINYMLHENSVVAEYTATSFNDLPSELVVMVAKALEKKDIKSLTLASRGLNYILTPVLNKCALAHGQQATALYWAARTKNEKLIRLLATEGSDVQVLTTTDPTITTLPIDNKDADNWVEHLIHEGSGLVVQDTYCYDTPLHIAAKLGSNIILRLLLDMGVDMEIRNRQGQTALHQAVFTDNSEAVKLLLNRGANIHCQDHEGKSVLHIAACTRNKAMVEYLLEAGADLTLTDTTGDNAVDAVDWAPCSNSDSLRLIFLRSAPANFTFYNEETGLHYAAGCGDMEIAIMFLEKGVDTNARDDLGATALHLAAANLDADMVSLLLRMGATVDAQDREGMTPLQLALMACGARGCKAVCTTLLENGASTSLRDYSGASAIDIVLDCGFARISLPAEEGEFMIQLLTDAGINYQDFVAGRKPLHWAA